MFDLEAVVDRVGLDDGHSPGRAHEGRSRGRGRRVERIVVRRVGCGNAKEPWVRH